MKSLPQNHIVSRQGFLTGALGTPWGPRSRSPVATSRGLY